MDWVVGVDEVGCGSWAGPIYVCAVAVPTDWNIPGLRDSKRLEKKEHEMLFRSTQDVERAIEIVSLEEINREGAIWPLVSEAHKKVVEALLLKYPKAIVVIDGTRKPKGLQAHAVAKADNFVPAVMMAAVIAKFSRDSYMREQAKIYPQYGFETNVGYGTAHHAEALARFGPCEIHRTWYEPVAHAMEHPLPDDCAGLQPVNEEAYCRWRGERSENSEGR